MSGFPREILGRGRFPRRRHSRFFLFFGRLRSGSVRIAGTEVVEHFHTAETSVDGAGVEDVAWMIAVEERFGKSPGKARQRVFHSPAEEIRAVETPGKWPRFEIQRTSHGLDPGCFCGRS